MKENGLAALDAAQLEQQNVGGQVAVGESGRVSDAHVVGYLVDNVAIDNEIFGPGVESGQTNDSVTNLGNKSYLYIRTKRKRVLKKDK